MNQTARACLIERAEELEASAERSLKDASSYASHAQDALTRAKAAQTAAKAMREAADEGRQRRNSIGGHLHALG